MAEMAVQFPNYQFVIAGSPNRNQDFYTDISKLRNIAFVPNKTYDLLSISYAALVTSGTATLETALFKVPQVVCYKTSSVSYSIAKFLVKDLKYISLVNLVMDAPVVTELIQDEFNQTQLKLELDKILQERNRTVLFEKYLDLEEKLGGKGASYNVATLISKKNS